jgi:hypothetical protein
MVSPYLKSALAAARKLLFDFKTVPIVHPFPTDSTRQGFLFGIAESGAARAEANCDLISIGC